MVQWCPRCWQENSYSAERCSRCGADLRHEAGERVDRLINALHHPLAPTRRMVAVLLGRTRDARSVEALGEAAHRAVAEQDWALLDGVVEGLAASGSPEALPVLVFIAENGYTGARSAAAEAIRNLRSRSD